MIGWLRRLFARWRLDAEQQRPTPVDPPVIHVSVVPPTVTPSGPGIAKATPRSRVDRSIITPLQVPVRPPRPKPKPKGET